MILPDSMACINTIFTTGQAYQMTCNGEELSSPPPPPPVSALYSLSLREESYWVKEEWGSFVRAG